jgi:hypothetical protein
VIDGYDTPTSLIVSNANTGSNITISVGSSFTLTNVPTVADDDNDILGASAGHTIVVFYDDITSGKRISANIQVIGAPSGWTLLGPGEYAIWGAKIAAVFYKTSVEDSTKYLEVLVYMNPLGDGNKLYLAIDVANRVLGIDKSTNTHDSGGDLTIGEGSFWMTNEAGIDYDFVAWCYRYDFVGDQVFKYSGAHKIIDDATSDYFTDVGSSVTFTLTNLISTNTNQNCYFKIPYDAMDAVSGNVVNIYVFYGKTGEGGAGYGGMRSIFPAGASVTFDPGSPPFWGRYVTRLTNKSPDITLP